MATKAKADADEIFAGGVPEPTQVPSVGRIVHYRLESGRTQGEVRPAIIVKVNEPDRDNPETTVNLNVFFDGRNDPFNSPGWAQRIHEGDGIGQWHWPEKV